MKRNDKACDTVLRADELHKELINALIAISVVTKSLSRRLVRLEMERSNGSDAEQMSK